MNFANWLQYYRSRSLMAKGGVAAAFAQQGTTCAWVSPPSTPAATVARGVATFTGTARPTSTPAYGTGTGGSTPLRRPWTMWARFPGVARPVATLG